MVGITVTSSDLFKLMPPQAYVRTRLFGLDPETTWMGVTSKLLVPLVKDRMLAIGINIDSLPTELANTVLLHGVNLASTFFNWQEWLPPELPPMHELPAGYVDENFAWLAEQTRTAIEAYQRAFAQNYLRSKIFWAGLLSVVPVVVMLLGEKL